MKKTGLNPPRINNMQLALLQAPTTCPPSARVMIKELKDDLLDMRREVDVLIEYFKKDPRWRNYIGIALIANKYEPHHDG